MRSTLSRSSARKDLAKDLYLPDNQEIALPRPPDSFFLVVDSSPPRHPPSLLLVQKTRTALDEDEISWRVADSKIKDSLTQISALGLPPPPSISEPPDGAEYEYEQLWQVRRFATEASRRVSSRRHHGVSSGPRVG